ncbi:MAG: GNAT family N-acetyltransferase [Planctomycetes bacterium]|nr:GNAT family N-acetyltransferase [Planctomycetota bacterium]
MIRLYKDTDWLQVIDIYDRSKPDEMKGVVDSDLITSLSQDKKMIRYFNESEVHVYEEGKRILGFIGRKEDVLSWLFVHPNYRRKGIAKKLLSYQISAWSNTLMLNLVKSNHAALSLYKNFGFNIHKEFYGNMYGKRIPAIKMVLNDVSEPVV